MAWGYHELACQPATWKDRQRYNRRVGFDGRTPHRLAFASPLERFSRRQCKIDLFRRDALACSERNSDLIGVRGTPGRYSDDRTTAGAGIAMKFDVHV